MPTVPNAKLYRSYADLAAVQAEGEDYRVVVVPRATSRVAIVAPHGGSIEAHTRLPLAQSLLVQGVRDLKISRAASAAAAAMREHDDCLRAGRQYQIAFQDLWADQNPLWGIQ